MTNMNEVSEKILNKIKNLLDLANNNPNEHEALSASLKAQELLAKYNLDVADLADGSEKDKIEKAVWMPEKDYNYMNWRYELAGVIARNFCCKMYLLGGTKGIVFYGFSKDAQIAHQVFSYLFQIGNKLADKYYNECKKLGKPTKGVANDYLQGFTSGIAAALDKQCTALMLVVPKEVTESFEEMTAGWGTKATRMRSRGSEEAKNRGFQDGKDAVAARELENKRKEIAC